MKVLLSIKPEFAEMIFDGSKKYEFRKVIFRNRNVSTVVVYASSPVQKVIGEFDIDFILEDYLDSLWVKTKDFAGIDETYFNDYFAYKEKGYAIKIKKVKRYSKNLCIKKDFNIDFPPQSFIYLDQSDAIS